MHHSEELLALIDGRLDDARREIAALQAARTAIGAPQPATRTAAPAAERANGTRSRAGTRSQQRPARTPRNRPTRVAPAGKLEALLGAESDGLTTAGLAERADADPAQVLALLREMESAGRIRRSGQRRGTRWHMITDEDRIAARAAELAAQSRRNR